MMSQRRFILGLKKKKKNPHLVSEVDNARGSECVGQGHEEKPHTFLSVLL